MIGEAIALTYLTKNASVVSAKVLHSKTGKKITSLFKDLKSQLSITGQLKPILGKNIDIDLISKSLTKDELIKYNSIIHGNYP
jgi:hypothetical protein